MRIVSIPCLKDNYAYLVICEATRRAAVVDPSEAAPVLAAVRQQGVELEAIWNTHHHWDHTGGNQELVTAVGGIEVVAHESDKGRVPAQTRFVSQGDTVSIGQVVAEIIFNPGHTSGAISFHIPDPGAVFTGDTLFGAGCGRLFEGTPADMHASLTKLAALPGHTSVYCGHEYTESNLVFAAEAEQDNPAIAERRARVAALRKQGQPSVPFTMAEEVATNPFVRAGSVERLGELRKWKDDFKPR
ncbi:MAG TPA: hydroxyacylglutathione hydrolase [Kofleriaceae bacterium]|nr:hydroxyacylglutathione hydrolase [Kofleriaceae bacterium]